MIKCEYGLRPSEKEKEKDREKESRRIITGVGKKADREFVVFTVRHRLIPSVSTNSIAGCVI